MCAPRRKRLRNLQRAGLKNIRRIAATNERSATAEAGLPRMHAEAAQQADTCFTAYLPNGKLDKSESWEAGVRDAEPGIVMLANPRIPDAYRQEYLKEEAEDTAWIVRRGGSISVPFGPVHHVLTTLEFARIEPDVVDQKIYGPGIGIVRETALSGPPEVAKLVRMTG